MDTAFVDAIGNMMVDIILFISNLAPGYIIMMIMLFIGALVVIIFKNFRQFIVAPKY